MKFSTLPFVPGWMGLLGPSAWAQDKNTPLDSGQKAFLAHYETVRSARAADDLQAAKQAAAMMITEPQNGRELPATVGQPAQPAAFTEPVNRLAQVDSLQTARAACKLLSKRAIHLAGGKLGHCVAHSPLVENNEGDWVQTTGEISNPYPGSEMPTCRSIKP